MLYGKQRFGLDLQQEFINLNNEAMNTQWYYILGFDTETIERIKTVSKDIAAEFDMGIDEAVQLLNKALNIPYIKE